MNTKENCKLQIQSQKDLNASLGMEQIEDEMYVNCLTEEELDGKIKRILDSKRFNFMQRTKIRKFFRHIKQTGWFQRFEYKGYMCAVEFDELGRWRIFFKPKKGESQSPLYDHQCNCCYCGYYGSGSCRFGLEGFPLGLWDYSDKIGLDDFIGLSTFSEFDWKYDYFETKKRSKKHDINKKLFDINFAVSMCKRLIDCWVAYQKNKIVLN